MFDDPWTEPGGQELAPGAPAAAVSFPRLVTLAP
jgi:hypothetical protein